MLMAMEGPRRLMKASAGPVAPTRDYLDEYLYRWAQWQRSGQSVEGLPRASTGLSNGGASQAFDDMLEAEGRRIAAITDAVINELAPHMRIALHHRYLHAVYRFRGQSVGVPYLQALEGARAAVRVGLKRKHVWMG